MKKLLFILLASTFAFKMSAQVDLKKGLMLYLPFNGNTLDASPNANHATNYGATLTTDQWGNPNSAYQFNGTSSYMKIMNSTTLQIDSQITLTARIKVNGFYDGPCYGNNIIQKGNADFITGNYGLRFGNSVAGCAYLDTLQQNYLGFFASSYPAGPIYNTTPHIVKEGWSCLVFTYDRSMAKMYVDGILRHQYPETSFIGKNADDVFLGHLNDFTYPYWFNGVMDEVRIYNRALNIAEIDSVCSNVKPQEMAIYNVQEVKSLPILSNPVNNELILSLPGNKMGGILQIFDMEGRRVMNIPGLQNANIPLDAVASGVYLVSYQLGSSYMTGKMIKK